MIKRTLVFSKPYFLFLKDHQLFFELKDEEIKENCPIEDLGFIIIENPQILITPSLISELSQNNVAVIFCNENHYPQSMLFNLEVHHTHAQIINYQLDASKPLIKQLWKKTVEAKILNQYLLTKKLGIENTKIKKLSENVLSNDTTNVEGLASRLYWDTIFIDIEFKRERFGNYPNNFLNYGYAILRAAVARAITGSGLLPIKGIHHHNKYNFYCLADDIMEPYRPFIDDAVYNLMQEYSDKIEIDTIIKKELLSVLMCDVNIGDVNRPLLVALSYTTASLVRSFKNNKIELQYPILQ